MNCPSRTDETIDHEGWNQNPSRLAADLTTRQDLNGITNSRAQRDHRLDNTELAEGICTVIDHNRVTEVPGVLQKTGCEPNTNADRKLQPLEKRLSTTHLSQTLLVGPGSLTTETALAGREGWRLRATKFAGTDYL
jgi:hypothetical protein